ncbi:CBO0543 family protein [Paenibacillus oryzisoli]|uniref:Uncharacterized protein n=1 Tax=Paenibacillus oryzisoli TaxID=1850517 RepID=A0A198A1A2_9BACL|nr:CBO0543 family protein [Paenibacillus oryzisoli]OAS14796.1 hypothetical protein A8708_04640 [Paenibacillus oryzisoli]
MRTVQDPEKIKEIGEFFRINSENSTNYYWYWTENTLFQWDFWLSWMFAIIPWIVWSHYHKKKSRGRLLLVGFIAITITSWMDFIGVNIGLWYYTGLAIPTIPSYAPWDFSLLPVFIMFLLQIKPNTSKYLKAAIFSIVSSFVGEPIFLWLGFYKILHWNLFYSLPIYFVIYLICNRVSKQKYFEEL